MKRHSLSNISGVSLIELLVAVVMLAIAGVSIAIFFPRASKSTIINRQVSLGNNMALSKLEEIEKTPYAAVTPSSASATYFPLSGTINTPVSTAQGGCDCHLDTNSINLIPFNDTLINNQPAGDQIIQNDVVYSRHVCINQLQGQNTGGGVTWKSFCAQTNGWQETGLKYVHVRVSWPTGHTDAQGVIAQQ